MMAPVKAILYPTTLQRHNHTRLTERRGARSETGKIMQFLKLFVLVGLLLVSTLAAEEDFKIEVTEKPESCEKAAEDGDYLSVHYTGSFAKDGQKFDSSRDRNEPFSFILGNREVILGYEKGLQGMCVGEKRKLTVPPEMAYGEHGYGDMIPPNATLVFEIELMKLQNGTEAPKRKPPNVFGMIDRDGDKKITKEEVKEYFVHGSRSPNPDEEAEQRANEVFEKEDVDKDGFISFEEFSGPKHEEL